MGNRKEPIETEWSGIPNHHALHNRQSSTLQLLRRLAVRRLALRWRRIPEDHIPVKERFKEGDFENEKPDAGDRESRSKSVVKRRVPCWGDETPATPATPMIWFSVRGRAAFWRGVIFSAISNRRNQT